MTTPRSAPVPGLFQRGLDLEDVPRNRHVPGLRSECVRFAAHFLKDEFEFAARFLSLANQVRELRQVALNRVTSSDTSVRSAKMAISRIR